MKSLCSVIVPTQNRRDRLMKTLTTIRAQSYQPLEIIVSDDGSDDDTVDVVRRLADRRIRVISSAEATGVAGARNRGIAEAKGDWIAFCDDDDLWACDKLANQIELVERTGRQWSFCYAVDVDDELKFISTQGDDVGPDPYRRLLFGDNVVPGGCSTVLASRRLLETVGGFDQHLSMLADLDLWIRLAAQSRPAVSPTYDVAYIHHGQQMSLDMSKVQTELSLIRSKNSVQRATYPKPSYEPIDSWVVQRSWIGGDRLAALRHAVRGPGSMLWLNAALTIGSAIARNLVGYRRFPKPAAIAALASVRETLEPVRQAAEPVSAGPTGLRPG